MRLLMKNFFLLFNLFAVASFRPFTTKFMYLCAHEKIGLLIPVSAGVGKSGHHRAAKRITSVTREGRTSATESRYSSAVVKPGKLFAVQW
ncbi:hypothetical protein SAMN05421768_102579 [Chryseobacterium joostei]|uniref:Secreted protein n=1 Tax=Chryseobacterium joostei TaxID=112234 RepID=A0A1N7I448_9FLAO|nr:hypothetical protein SAMN05421768_102579 [Chryseobacterium joostei]